MAVKTNIYVIDDDEAVLDSLAQLLCSYGYEQVQTFRSAEAFLIALDSNIHGCLITDFLLPDMNGLELYEKLANRNMHLVTILISGRIDSATIRYAQQKGIFAVIDKPFDDAVLLRAVAQALTHIGLLKD